MCWSQSLQIQSERSLIVVAKRYQHVYAVLHYELLILNFCFFTKSWAILSPVRVSKVWRIGWSGINIRKEKGKGRVCMRNVCCWYQTSLQNASCLKWTGGATDVLATLKCCISCSRLLSIYEYSDDKHRKCKWYTPFISTQNSPRWSLLCKWCAFMVHTQMWFHLCP